VPWLLAEVVSLDVFTIVVRSLCVMCSVVV